MINCIRLTKHIWPPTPEGSWPKVNDSAVVSALCKVLRSSVQPIARHRSRRATGHFVYYQEAAQYWIKATSHLPFYAKNGVEMSPSHGRWLNFDTAQGATVAAAVLNSSLFYAYFIAFGDCFHVTDTLVVAFPVPDEAWRDKQLISAGKLLMQALKKGAVRKSITSRQSGRVDRIEYDEYYAGSCKDIIDSIDQRLAVYFGFVADEADAISAFDLQFRVNGESEEPAGA